MDNFKINESTINKLREIQNFLNTNNKGKIYSLDDTLDLVIVYYYLEFIFDNK